MNSVYLRALSLLPVILKVTKYCALWVKVHIAWLLFDGVVSLCVHLSGIRWVRICVSVFFFALHHVALHTSLCAVEWSGVGLITSNCTCIHTLSYATGRYVAVVQMKDVATLKMLKMLLRWRCWRCCYVEDVEDVATLKMLHNFARTSRAGC